MAMVAAQYVDTLSKIFAEMSSASFGGDKQKSAERLKRHAINVSRELSGDQFTKFMNDINRKIFEFIHSNDLNEKLCGVVCIEALASIEVEGEETGTKVARFANYLRNVIPGSGGGSGSGIGGNNVETQIIVLAAKALGNLAQYGGTLTAEFVDFEVGRCIEWITGERMEHKRFAAVCVLHELTLSAPTLLYAYTNQIVELIWYPLRDVKQAIRESAAECLSCVITSTRDREEGFKAKWYTRLVDETLKGFKSSSIESVHASLLVLESMLKFSNDGLNEHYVELCDLVLKHKDNKDVLIRKSVMTVLPLLASFKPDAFVSNYLASAMSYLVGHLKKDKDKVAAFNSCGGICVAVQSSITQYLPQLITSAKESLSVRGRSKNFADIAAVFHFVAMLSQAVGQGIVKDLRELTELMLSCGLSDALRTSLAVIAENVPQLLHYLQVQMLNLVSMTLSGSPFRPAGSLSVAPLAMMASNLRMVIVQEDKNVDLFVAAFNVLSEFNFKSYTLTHFAKDVVLAYLDDDINELRRSASICALKIMENDPIEYKSNSNMKSMYKVILHKLVNIAVGDPDVTIRRVILSNISQEFDILLSSKEFINSLFFALNDEDWEVRSLCVDIIGRLTLYNPAHIMPSLRKVFLRLMSDLEYSNVSKSKEESATLLSLLITACQRLIKPYVGPMMDNLLLKVGDPSPSVSAQVMLSIGELAAIGRESMAKYLPQLMPVLIDTIQDQSSVGKRESALKCLGQIAANCPYVVQPYFQHPQLLPLLLNILQSESVHSIRIQTMRVLGILGALDPYRHRMNQNSIEDAVDLRSMAEVDALQLQTPSQNEDYYSQIAVNSLIKILNDSTLTVHHTAVIQGLIYIIKSLGFKSVSLLPIIMPPFLTMMRNAPQGLLEFYIQQLGALVSVVKQHIRNYLVDILDMVKLYWGPNGNVQLTILTLIESIAMALDTEFRIYLPKLLGHMLQMLEVDRSERRVVALKVLHALVVFGSSVEDYLSLIMPALLQCAEKEDEPIMLRKSCIITIGKLSKNANIQEYAARIVHSMERILLSPNTVAELKTPVIDALCAVMYQLRLNFVVFVPSINKILKQQRIVHPNYTLLVQKLIKKEPLPQEFGADADNDQNTEDVSVADSNLTKKLPVNQMHLKKAWETGQRSAKEDWQEWLRRLSVELLKESPSHALRACASLASSYHPLASWLFNAAFTSCWSELYDQLQDELVRAIESALTSPTVPPEVVQILLNLTEFMEHDEKILPIDSKLLGNVAAKFHAYAKALHMKENEFINDPLPETVEALISINNQLQQPDSATGLLKFVQQKHNMELKEAWYESLQRWDLALESYEKSDSADIKKNPSIVLGRLRCLHALGEWDKLNDIAQQQFYVVDDSTKRTLSPLATAAAWGLKQWQLMDDYVQYMKPDSPDATFFKVILAIKRDDHNSAYMYIDKTRDFLDSEIKALVGESYSRAYNGIVRIQILSELEEILVYKKFQDIPERQAVIKKAWSERLKGCQRNLDIWQRVLRVRGLVLDPKDDVEIYVKYANLCRKSGRNKLADDIYVDQLGANKANPSDITSTNPIVTYNYLKHIWESSHSNATFSHMKQLSVTMTGLYQGKLKGSMATEQHIFASDINAQLLARCHLKLGQWQHHLDDTWSSKNVHSILRNYEEATKLDPQWYKAWHTFALANFEVASLMEKAPELIKSSSAVTQQSVSQSGINLYVVQAIQGFFRSISLSKGNSLQDTLRLLTLWFKHGHLPEVYKSIMNGIESVSIDTWLQVIPQLIARIHTPSEDVRKLNHYLLTEIGKAHPQALVYSLTVASKSQSIPRRNAALMIMDKMRHHSSRLVEQALLVSQELIRVSILWHEMWHEALEDASRLYFGEHNVQGMFEKLEPLHAMLENGGETLREVSFLQCFGRDLQEAAEWCRKFKQSGVENDINQAWDLYYSIFRRINKQLPQLTTLELQYVSPKLLNATDLELAIPGTYKSGDAVVRIKSFAPSLSVITSKQRPRKLTIVGSDGKQYQYLLKGHEDLRQDERVMQLFGLVNTLLMTDPETYKRHLAIQRYPVIPLSPNSGLIGWVPNCDTLHSLIRDYREGRKVLLNIEHRLMLQMAPDYDNLSLMQKIEVFQYALEQTTGQDLQKVLWLKSSSSESWLDRRTNYVRSLAVMSIVGYILGLGDRHPSNLMLDKYSGKIIHIDFGDCFEVAMQRDKFPEKIPFRLTRMLINAMEVSGIEGSFRSTAENVMRVVRESKDSLMAVLEAFVHDPLINWRLFGNVSVADSNNNNKQMSDRDQMQQDGDYGGSGGIQEEGDEDDFFDDVTQAMGSMRQKSLRANAGAAIGGGGPGHESMQDGDMAADKGKQKPEVLNAKAVAVIKRVQNKLTGKDFKTLDGSALEVEAQIEKLIQQATAIENLCQCYIGWCPFW
ncbi:hypothetical protein MIR68_003698 [Amoeboaphelidium protococcarum]|nr:hypothetical protein MIR68_003698 [Amoeboaphelidium protococcarum]